MQSTPHCQFCKPLICNSLFKIIINNTNGAMGYMYQMYEDKCFFSNRWSYKWEQQSSSWCYGANKLCSTWDWKASQENSKNACLRTKWHISKQHTRRIIEQARIWFLFFLIWASQCVMLSFKTKHLNTSTTKFNIIFI